MGLFLVAGAAWAFDLQPVKDPICVSGMAILHVGTTAGFAWLSFCFGYLTFMLIKIGITGSAE